MASEIHFTNSSASLSSLAATQRWHAWFHVFVIVVAGLAAYSSGMSGVFLFDDLPSIVDSQLVKGPIFSSFQSTRPLTLATFCVNYNLAGMSTFGFHCFNVAVHVAAAVMLYWLLLMTFSTRNFEKLNARWLAFGAATIWCVHPLNTQSVTYIVQRAESMTGLFFFSFLYFLAKSDGSKRERLWLGGAFVALALGLGCKQVMLMALPVGLLYDKVFLSGSLQNTFKARGWFWCTNLSMVAIAALVVAPNVLGSAGGVGFDLANINFIEYLTTQPKVILYYLRLVVFPSPLILDYGWRPETRLVVLASTTALCVAIVVISGFAVRNNSHWGFWPLGALLVLAPTSSVIPLVDLLVEHRMYIPGAFVIAMLSLAATRVLSTLSGESSEKLSLMALSVIGLILAVVTWQRNQVYRSSITMWENVVQHAPQNWRGYFNLGCELEDIDPSRSYQMYEKSIELNPRFAASLSNLGLLQLKQGKTVESIENISRALALDDKFVDAYLNLGLALKARGDEASALKLFTRALELAPNSSKGHYNLGTLYARSNVELAVKHLRMAIQLDPDFSQSHNNLAALIEEQDPHRAMFHYREAIRVDPKNDQAKRNLETLTTALNR